MSQQHKDVCTYYVAGRCKHGNKCSKSHDTTPPTPSARNGFASGTKGGKVPANRSRDRSQPMTPASVSRSLPPDPDLDDDPNDDNGPGDTRTIQDTRAARNKPTSLSIAHDKNTNAEGVEPASKSSTCVFYRDWGGCNDANCRFAHDLGTSAPASVKGDDESFRPKSAPPYKSKGAAAKSASKAKGKANGENDKEQIGKDGKGASKKSRHLKITSRPNFVPRVACKYYQAGRVCHIPGCTFSHDGPATTLATKSATASGQNSEGESKSSKYSKTRPLPAGPKDESGRWATRRDDDEDSEDDDGDEQNDDIREVEIEDRHQDDGWDDMYHSDDAPESASRNDYDNDQEEGEQSEDDQRSADEQEADDAEPNDATGAGRTAPQQHTRSSSFVPPTIHAVNPIPNPDPAPVTSPASAPPVAQAFALNPPTLPPQHPQRQANIELPPGYLVPEIPPSVSWSSFADPYANILIPFCKMHAQGFCQMGDRCGFRHSLTPQEYTLLFHDRQPPLMTLKQDYLQAPVAQHPGMMYVASTSHGTTGISSAQAALAAVYGGSAYAPPAPAGPAPVQAPPPPPPPPAQKECSFYAKGTCRNGSTCPFQHIDRPGANNWNNTDNVNANTVNNNYNPPDNHGQLRMCRNWETTGDCKFGTSCKFSHGGQAGSGDQNGSWPSKAGGWANEGNLVNGGWGTGYDDPNWATDKDDNGGWANDVGGGWGDDAQEEGEEQEKPEEAAWGTWDAPDFDLKQPPPESKDEKKADDRKGNRNMAGKDIGKVDEDDAPVALEGTNAVPDDAEEGRNAHLRNGDNRLRNEGSRNLKSLPKTRAVCVNFARGLCWKGDNCPQGHADPRGLEALERVGTSRTGDLPVSCDDATDSPSRPERELPDEPHVQGSAPVYPAEDDQAPDEQPYNNYEDEHPFAYEHQHDDFDELDREREERHIALEEQCRQLHLEFERVAAAYPGWNNNHQSDPMPEAEPDPEPSYRAICVPFHSDGYCEKGDECPLEHMSPPEATPNDHPTQDADTGFVEETHHGPNDRERYRSRSPFSDFEPEPIVYPHPDVHHTFLQCVVQIGPDSTPSCVETGNESFHLDLANLPSDVTPAEVEVVAKHYGSIDTLLLVNADNESSDIRVTYSSSKEAMNAFVGLHGSVFQARTILAKLDSRLAITTRAPAETATLKVSWPRPSRVGWAFFSTIRLAKEEATRMNGTIYNHRQLTVTFIPPASRKTNDRFPVKIQNLAPDAKPDDIQKIFPGCSAPHVDTEVLNQDDRTAEIQAAVKALGDIHDWDLKPMHATSSSNVAFLTYHLAEVATSAYENIRAQAKELQVSVEPVFFCRYRCLSLALKVLHPVIEQLNIDGTKKYTIDEQQQTHQRGTSIVRIWSPTDRTAAFKKANRELRKHIEGLVIKDDNGLTLWDDYFDTSSCDKVFNTLNRDALFYLHRDSRKKQIVVFGPLKDQLAGRGKILKLFQKLSDRRRETSLPRTQFRELVYWGLAKLQEELGDNRVSLDIVNSKLIIRWESNKDLERADNIVASFANVGPEPESETRCPICWHAAELPTQLSCRHTYCLGCLQVMFRSHASAPYRCIAPANRFSGYGHSAPNGQENSERCSAYVPFVVIRDLLTAAERIKIAKNSFLSHVSSAGDALFFCPLIECEAVYRAGRENTSMHCYECKTDICLFCRGFAHPGEDCTTRILSQQDY